RRAKRGAAARRNGYDRRALGRSLFQAADDDRYDVRQRRLPSEALRRPVRDGMIPDWFWKAVETPSAEHKVEVDECDVAYRTWGDVSDSRPPLLFIHGMNAHSHWWDFI